MIHRLYGLLGWLMTPVLLGFMALRWKRGKEHKTRYPERFGRASIPRPSGSVIWMHGASVGEVLSLAPLITLMKARDPSVHVLITSGTVTSAALVEKRLGSTVIHQFIPLDHPLFCKRFLDHWQPSAVYWVESDLWLGMLGDVKKRQLPAFLINARMSEKSYGRWQRMPRLIRQILSVFSVILASDVTYQQRFAHLSGRHVHLASDLKYDSPLNDSDAAARQNLKVALGEGPLWMLASSHDPEEALAMAVHHRLLSDFPAARLIIAPRHPHRRDAIVAAAQTENLSLTLRSRGEDPIFPVYLADTMGELDLFYSLCPIILVGGSFIPHGGQNVFEPARHGCAVLHGPHMENFPRMVADLGDALIPIRDAEHLYQTLVHLFSDAIFLAHQQDLSRQKTSDLQGAAEMIYDMTQPLWP